MKSSVLIRAAAVLCLGVLVTACNGSATESSATTTRPPPADQCEMTAREVVDRLEEFLDRFSDLTPEEFLALDNPGGLDDFQSDVRQIFLQGVVAGCAEEPLTQALDAELERLTGQGRLAEFLSDAIRSGGQVPARDVLVGPGEDLSTIVASLGPGSVVTLAAGTHILAAPLVIDAGLTFVGAGTSQTIVSSSAPDAAVAVVGRGSLAMRDLTLEHTGAVPASLLVAFQGPIVLERVRLTGATASEEGEGGTGLVLLFEAVAGEAELTGSDDSAAQRFDIVDSEFAANETAGIAIGADIAPTIINNLVADNGGCGICYFDTAGGQAGGNTVERNAFGIQVADQSTPLIEGNRLRDNTSAGLVVDGSASPTAIGNTIEGNAAAGIQVQGTAAPSLRDNRIGAHPVAMSMVDSTSVFAQGNTMDGAEIAVQVGGQAAPRFEGNLIRNSAQAAIVFSDDAAGTVTDNEIAGNGGAGIVVGDSATPRLIRNTIGDGTTGVAFIENSAGQLEDNVIRGQEIGIEVSGDAMPHIERNEVIDVDTGGIVFGDRAGGVTRNNTVLNPGAVGIQVAGFSDPLLESNVIDAGEATVAGDSERVGVLYADESAGSAVGNQVLNFTIGVQVGGSSAPTLDSNFVDGGSPDGVGVLYGGQSSGIALGNQTVNHAIGFQVGDTAAPLLDGNTVDSAEVAAFLLSGAAAGALDGNSCPSGVPGIALVEDAAPELGENDCTVLAG